MLEDKISFYLMRKKNGFYGNLFFLKLIKYSVFCNVI